MKWSRGGSEAPGTVSVLRFPSGIQAELVLYEPAEPSEEAPEPAEADDEQHSRPPHAGFSPFNARALLVWNMAGFSLFGSGRRPSLQEVIEEARAVVVALELAEKADNITHVAAALGTSRRAVREYLKRIGLYDWTRTKGDDEEVEVEVEADTRVDTHVHEEARLDG